MPKISQERYPRRNALRENTPESRRATRAPPTQPAQPRRTCGPRFLFHPDRPRRLGGGGAGGGNGREGRKPQGKLRLRFPSPAPGGRFPVRGGGAERAPLQQAFFRKESPSAPSPLRPSGRLPALLARRGGRKGRSIGGHGEARDACPANPSLINAAPFGSVLSGWKIIPNSQPFPTALSKLGRNFAENGSQPLTPAPDRAIIGEHRGREAPGKED